MAPLQRRPMQHIDRRELYTNLETRVQYLHSFLDFSSRDIEALTTGAKYIRALIPAIVNIVYKKLLQYDITARAFSTRSTSFNGPIDPNLTEYSPQILHRKLFLRGYLNKLCSDPSKLEFWEYLDKVGMMHVGQGREKPLHVEYVHIGATLSFVQDVLTEAILSHPKLKMEKKIALVKALSKVIWIQNDLFAKWYVRDGEEFEDEKLVPEIEAEGYLHGKKILHDGSESESEIEDAASSAGTCPFKGLGMGMGMGPAPVRRTSSKGTSSEEEETVVGSREREERGGEAHVAWKDEVVDRPQCPVAHARSSSGIPRPLSMGSS